MFLGDASMRNKYNLILCEAMDPQLPADEYMDKNVNEDELKQVGVHAMDESDQAFLKKSIFSVITIFGFRFKVLGDIRAAYDVTKTNCIIIGKDGLLVSGKNVLQYEVRHNQ